MRPRTGSGAVVAGRWMRVEMAEGWLVSAGPLRQVPLTRLPADIAAAAD